MGRATAIAVVGIVTSSIVIACSDSMRPIRSADSESQKIRDGVQVSGPLQSTFGVTASGTIPDSALVFVSMPPGTLGAGDSVQVRATSAPTSVGDAIMGDGGFDPIAIYARAADSVEIAVFEMGTVKRARVRVPAFRQPSVVRTTPPRGRTDVPLNQKIVIVFSQPLNDATVTPTSVQLTLNGLPVPTTLNIDVAQPWVVLLSPTSPLSADETYRITVQPTITDVNGSALAAPYSADFTTGTSTESVASIAVTAPDGFSRFRIASSAIAAPGGKSTFVAQEMSTAGDTLINEGIDWSTSAPAIATVVASGEGNATGTVTALAVGEARIIACKGTVCGEGLMTVEAPAVGLVPTEIGDLGGGDSRVWDMKGDYVGGSSSTAGSSCVHAFLWSAVGGMEDLGTLPGQCTSAVLMMNATPVVIGYGDFAGPNNTVVYWIWSRSSGMRPLTLPDRLSIWSPIAINERGDIVMSDTLGSVIRDINGHFRPIARQVGFVQGLNDRDQVVVSTVPVDTSYYCGTVAYVWDARSDRLISSISGADPSGKAMHLCPAAINNEGDVAGTVNSPKDERAFRWSASGGLRLLASPAAGVTTEAARLNERGDLSVYLLSYPHFGSDSIFDVKGAIWKANGTLINLGGLGGNHTTANGLTESDFVAGHSQVGSNTGPLHAVIWNLNAPSTSLRPAPSNNSAARQRRTGEHAGVLAKPLRTVQLPMPHNRWQ